jgi:putative tryptophan/tyrosine transport system substrate-binding protein
MTMKGIVGVWLAATFVLAFYRAAETQQTSSPTPRIGFILSSGAAGTSSPQLDAFTMGLRDLGYVEGENILFERRYAEGRLDRMGPFVREFVKRKVNIIMGVNNVVIRSAKEATTTIPIVMMSSIDPVAAGYVESFAQPGGNITGLARLTRDLSAKRIEILKELLPKASKVGILWDTAGPGPAVALKEYEKAAHGFKLEFHSFEIRASNPDLAGAFRAAKKQGIDSLVVVANPLTDHYAKQVFKLARSNRLPTMSEERRYLDAGSLLSYGSNSAELYRRAAVFVDKILKGEHPAELPVEQPTNLEFVINLKTAKDIGLTIPAKVLARADHVLE